MFLEKNHIVMLFPLGKCVGKEQTRDQLHVSPLVYESEVWEELALGPGPNLLGHAMEM